VPPDGRVSANIAFVGEGPGFWEDRQGRAFIGRSGKIYERLLASVGLKRQQVWTTNAAMCMPEKLPKKGLSLKKCKEVSVNRCKSRLLRELKRVRPKVIVAFGNLAMKSILGFEGIQKRHGSLHVVNLDAIGREPRPGDFAPNNITYVIPLFHPAYMLRGKSGYYPIVAQKLAHAKYLLEGGQPTAWRELFVSPYGFDVEKKVEMLEEAVEYVLKNDTKICIDYEADGTSPLHSNVTVFGFGVKELGLGLAVSVLQWHAKLKKYVFSWPQHLWERVVSCIQRIQESKLAKWFHNFGYDVIMGRRFTKVNGKIGDTIVLSNLYQNDVLNSLGFRCASDLLIAPWKDDLHVREKKLGVRDEDLQSYNCKDTIFDVSIVGPLVEKVNKRCMGHLLEKQMNNTEMARRASLHGLPVNKVTLDTIRRDYTDERDKRLNLIIRSMQEEQQEQPFNDYIRATRAKPEKHKHIPLEKFNPRSAEQSRFFLYEHLGLRPLYFTAGGAEEDEEKKKPSHSYKSVLEYLELPLVKTYVEYWEYGYVLTNVLKAYAGSISNNNAFHQLWLYSSWSANSQKGTRFTSFPNIQNVEKKIRRMFEAPPGFVWLGVDLSQVEYRVASCLAGIPELLTLFNTVYFDEEKEEWKKYDGKYDGHSLVAEVVFGDAFRKAPLNKKKALRTLVKRVVYALFYGALASKIYHTLRRDRRVSTSVRAILNEDRIEKIRSGFGQRFPQWDTWADKEEYLLKTFGFQIYPPCDRRGYVPLADIAGVVKPTELRNVPIQRSAGDIVSEMMWQVELEADKQNLDGRFSIHLHDAGYWLAPIDHAKRLLRVINKAFDTVLYSYEGKDVRIYGQGGVGRTVMDVG